MKNDFDAQLPVHRLFRGLNDWASRFPGGDPELWDVQNEALQGLRDVITSEAAKGAYAFYYHMFTGTGKTHLAIKAIGLMAQAEDGSVPKTIIRAPTRFRVKEILDEIKRFAPALVGKVGLYYSDERDPFKQIIITTFPGFAKGAAKEYFDPKAVDLIITDEMHEGLSQKRLDDVEPFSRAVKIGLTATPEYSADRAVGHHYRLAYKLDHEKAIQKGVIVPFRNVLIRSNANLDDVDIGKDGDFDLVALARKINTKARNEAAIKFYRDFAEPTTGQKIMGRQALAFCVDIQHAKDFAKQSNDALQKYMPAGVKFCEAVWGDHPDLQRVLDDYAQGKIMCLSNAVLLTRAYNQPRAAICMNLAPTRSSVVAGQRPGRVLRSDKDKPFAIIAEIVDDVTDPERMPLLYAEYLNGAAFGTIFKDDPDFIPSKVQADHVEDDIQDQDGMTLKRVMATREEVMAFLHHRRLMKEELLRTGVINDTVLPSLRAKMTENGIKNIYQLWLAVKDRLPLKAEQRAFDDYVPTYRRFCRICTAVLSAWDLTRSRPEKPVPTIETFVVAAYFKMGSNGVQNLFGPLKNRRNKVLNNMIPYDRDQHERFVRAMEAVGYTGHGAIARLKSSLILNRDINIKTFTYLIRGQISPIQKSTGQFSSLAQEVALVLNMSEEELFGVTSAMPVWVADPDTRPRLFEDEENIEPEAEGGFDKNSSIVLQLKKIFTDEKGESVYGSTFQDSTSSPDQILEGIQDAVGNGACPQTFDEIVVYFDRSPEEIREQKSGEPKRMSTSIITRKGKKSFSTMALLPSDVSTKTFERMQRLLNLGIGIRYPIILTGAPGTGKSTTLRQVADQYLPTHAVILVPLTGHPDDQFIDLFDEAVQSKGHRVSTKLSDPKNTARYINELQGNIGLNRKVVFLFDGVEHLTPEQYSDFAEFIGHTCGPYEDKYLSSPNVQIVFSLDPDKAIQLEKQALGSHSPYGLLDPDCGALSLYVEHNNFSYNEVRQLIQMAVSQERLPPVDSQQLRSLEIMLLDNLYGHPGATVRCLGDICKANGQALDLGVAEEIAVEQGIAFVDSIIKRAGRDEKVQPCIVHNNPKSWDFLGTDDDPDDLSVHPLKSRLVRTFAGMTGIANTYSTSPQGLALATSNSDLLPMLRVLPEHLVRLKFVEGDVTTLAPAA